MKPISVFISYSHRDALLYEELAKHLRSLEHQQLITSWSDRRIAAGTDFDADICRELDHADLILLLISPDFISSEYCWGKELKRAMERHQAGNARVIPVILRPVEWQQTPFGKLLALPTDGRPVTRWENQDEAFLDIERGIRFAITNEQPPPPEGQPVMQAASPVGSRPSGNPSPTIPPAVPSSSAAVPAAATAPVTVHLSRAGSYSGKLRDFKVLVDEVMVAKIADDDRITFSIPPGRHTVRVKFDFYSSGSLTLDATAGRDIYLECGPGSLAASFLSPRSYLFLRQL
jgi:TIR domain